jgi:DNA-binding NtrC family response regulator
MAMARILIVDDDHSCRLTLTASVEQLNHEAFEFERSRDALEIFPLLRPDVVLLDLLMPEMDGIETMLAMRKIAHKTPIILLSDGGSIGIDPQFDALRMMGAFATLKKPFCLEELTVAVETALAQNAGSKKSSLPWLSQIQETGGPV